MYKDENTVINAAKLMYEHWNYSAVELCTTKELNLKLLMTFQKFITIMLYSH